MHNPKVSIIINCHNGAKFLISAIQSVFTQTYSNWEIVFFDNCSSDGSLKIIRKLDKKKIKIFKSKKKLSLYEARNKAVEKAKGKYICFLDTDDFYVKDKISKQIHFLEKNSEISMVYSNFYVLDEKNKKNFLFKNFLNLNGNITKNILEKYPIGILTTCIRKKIFRTIKFNKNYNIIGDFDFFVKLSMISKIGCINEPLAYYRIHDFNLSKKKQRLYIKELQEWIDKNNLKLAKKGFSLRNLKLSLFKLRIKHYMQQLGV